MANDGIMRGPRLGLAEYAYRLRYFDWSYEYSDDFRRWRNANDEYKWLREIARDNEGDWLRLFNYFRKP